MALLPRPFAFVMLTVLAAAASCSTPDTSVPVRPAPPSRHAALVDGLADDARAFAFQGGDWQEDQGDAPFFGLAWLSRRAASQELDADALSRRDAAVSRGVALLRGDPRSGAALDEMMAALGLMEHVAASGDRSVVAALDDFVDRLDAWTRSLGDYVDLGTGDRGYGPTAVTALVALVDAQYALLVGGGRADERIGRAVALDDELHDRAFTDLVDGVTGASVRGFAFAQGQPTLVDSPNVMMLLLEARLFRLTKKEDYRLQARALFAAVQALKLPGEPTRYASPSAKALLGVDTRDLSTLPGQNYVALALLLLFEITGDQRFVDEADRLVDGIAAMRGPWCTSQVHDGSKCSAACAAGQACLSSACVADRCTTGLLDHVVDGHLARPEDPVVFCSGCTLQTLYVLGYRRALAGEAF